MLELFHAAPSYYSMVARLALAEAGVGYTSRLMDIHLAKQQLSPAYRRLNPHMTVPTLRGPDLLLTDSAQILGYAAQQAEQRAERAWADGDASRAEAIQRAVAGHYALSIETLTFGKVLATRPWFKPVMVRMLSGINAKLEREMSKPTSQLFCRRRCSRTRHDWLCSKAGQPRLCWRSSGSRCRLIWLPCRLWWRMAGCLVRASAQPMWWSPCFARAWPWPVS
jgi:hypothetical protein